MSWNWIMWGVVGAVACLGWVLTFLGLVGSTVWALLDRADTAWNWFLGGVGGGGVLILLCAPFIVMMDHDSLGDLGGGGRRR